MHEGAIVKSVIDSVVSIREEEELINIKKIHLLIGRMHHIVGSVMAAYFDNMKIDYEFLKEATLEMKFLDVKIRCNECGKESIIEAAPIFLCPQCNGFKTEIIEGEELDIISIDGEKEN